MPKKLAALLAGAAALLSTARGQETPRFPAQASAITVDVVVVDAHGQPVRGLTRDDFTLIEDGHAQAIVGFEAHEAAAAAPPPAAAPEHAATNERAAEKGGRVFALVVDDLGLTPVTLQQLQAALGRWLRERAQPRDEVTLVTTSGDVWWSDRVDRGRDDLLAVLSRVRARKDQPSQLNGGLSDQEAYQIATLERHGQGNELVAPTGDEAVVATGPEAPPAPSMNARSSSVTERVAVRFLNANLCMLLRTGPSMRECMNMAEQAAQQVYGAWRRRAESVFRALERTSRDLEGLPGRKSIVLVAEDLMRDRQLDARFRAVIDAAQRGNTAVYFVGARGLAAPSFTGAENDLPPRAGDAPAMATEENVLAIGGAEHLADATGGLVIATANDLADGVERAAADGAAYYLLGYQPAQAPDGKWHRLEVKVARRGVTVRSRHEYLAGPPAPPPPTGAQASGPSLVSGPARAAIPLRMAAYVQGPDGAGAARVLLAIELDGERIQVSDGASGRAALDLGVTAVARDQPKVWPLDQSLDVTLRPADRAGWWTLFREVRLPPGVAQVRTQVRDRATGAAGSVSQRVEVPNVESPYLSTPLLALRTQPPAAAGEPPRLVPTASRRFAARGALFCQYELFGYAGVQLPGIARVTGGYTLTADDGRVVEQSTPTPIATDGQRVVRRLALPLERLAPGGYTLALEVEDKLAGRSLGARESFTIEADDPTRPPAGLLPVSDAHVAVMGRAERAADGRLRIGYPGVTLRMRFEGSGLALRAWGSTADVYVGVSVDGGAPRVVALPTTPGEVPLALDLRPGVHDVEVVHRDETWQGVATVEGVLPSPGTRLLPPPPFPPRRLLFVGDSVTCGEDVDRAQGACRKDASRWDASRSYGLRIARDLGAQAHLVCYGGRGLLRDWQGRRDVLNAPQFFDLAVPEDGGPAWDHAAYAPDVVVVSLGTNDFNAALGPPPARDEWVDAYVAFVRAVRARHPQAAVLLTDGALVDEPARTTLRDYLAETVRRLGDPRVQAAPTSRQPGDACDAHPTADQHEAIARELEPAVRAAAGW